jgi:hypothetical protein
MNAELEHVGNAKGFWSTMSFNAIWYIALFGWVIYYFVIPDAISAYANAKLVFKYFSWLLFISPSAAFCLTLTLAAIFLPIVLMLYIPTYFERTDENTAFRKRYIYTIVTVVAIWLAVLLIQFLIWGSFPIGFDKENYVHIRMIPFIPWPEAPMFR